jgi:hypothetical protein
MRILSTLIALRLVIFVIAALVVSGSASVAADRETRAPQQFCRWDGTAPFCDGGCDGGERYAGSSETSDAAKAYLEGVVSGVADSQLWRSFGKDCATGRKALCCFDFCPNGYTMVKGTCKNVSTKTRDLTLPVPEGPAKRKKGPIEAPGAVEGIKPKKGPIVAPGPVEETEVEKGPVIVQPDEPYVTKRKTGP